MSSSISPDMQRRALELAYAGATLQQVFDALQCNAYEFSCLLIENISFSDAFARARSFGYDVMTDQLNGITERIQDVAKARLESENIKWIASKRKPNTYGDRLDVNLQHTVDLTAALKDAKTRAFERGAGDGQTGQVLDFPAETPLLPTGSQPVAERRGQAQQLEGTAKPPSERVANASKTALEASPRRFPHRVNPSAAPHPQRVASSGPAAENSVGRACDPGADEDIWD